MTTDQLSALLAQDPAAVLEHDRRLYEQQIVRAADLIAAHAQERPAVLLAAVSSMAARCAGGPASWSFWRASTP